MRQREAEFVVHRILVVPGAFANSLAELATAADLAAAMEVELEEVCWLD
jgi:hypothetical protein